jgi:hypothetical protein
MAKAKTERKQRQKGGDEPARHEQSAKVPPGYLPTADPPRKNRVLLAATGILLGLWLVTLASLAFFG